MNIIMEGLETGRRWNGKEMETREDWKQEDEERRDEGEKKDTRTLRVVRRMSNSIVKCIEWKEDIPENQKRGKVPMLDFHEWK